ncbi:hypothetical protein [Leifsonia sp. Leaf264]|uniref:hypothetical protein n=1 Tax=Leifsonia sp. Leaf264 TaxID=1736314 RepID=UPI0006F8F3ED|nr:hypothetical protein [Leifsonia sp. Leaf264]KQO95932.1 aromatic ring-opening dioxygenase LigA [Leifsonia sp. Leaf264]
MTENVGATSTAVSKPARGLRVIGLLAIIGGTLFLLVGIIAWFAVSAQLSAEKITVSDDAPILAGAPVNGPITAYVQANIINTHALDASGGKTYAELPQDDPVRNTVMTASFLRASLFTSVVAFGVSLFAAAVGVLFILTGWAIRRLALTSALAPRAP